MGLCPRFVLLKVTVLAFFHADICKTDVILVIGYIGDLFFFGRNGILGDRRVVFSGRDDRLFSRFFLYGFLVNYFRRRDGLGFGAFFRFIQVGLLRDFFVWLTGVCLIDVIFRIGFLNDFLCSLLRLCFLRVLSL